jgi:hypothetical protein
MDVGKIHSIELLVGLTHMRQNNNVPRFHNRAHFGRKDLAPMVQTARSKRPEHKLLNGYGAPKTLNEERLLRGLEALSLEQLGLKIV